MTATYPADWYWWHKRITDQLRASGPYNVWGIAGNVGFTRLDTAHYVDQLLGWGMVHEVAPMWDGLPDSVKWVALTVDSEGE